VSTTARDSERRRASERITGTISMGGDKIMMPGKA